MARRTYRVSRYGLTACPGCAAHIKIDSVDWRETTCPFCDAALLAREPASLRVPGRAGLLAAGLLSLSLAACDDEGGGDAGTDPVDAVTDGGLGDIVSDDVAPPEPDTGPEPDMAPDMEPAPDFGGQPEYGGPPPDAGVEADMELAPEFGIQPEYGAPPPDFGHQPEVDMAVPAPLYGIPPMQDAGTPSTEDAEVDASDPLPVPLYGVPPQEA